MILAGPHWGRSNPKQTCENGSNFENIWSGRGWGRDHTPWYWLPRKFPGPFVTHLASATTKRWERWSPPDSSLESHLLQVYSQVPLGHSTCGGHPSWPVLCWEFTGMTPNVEETNFSPWPIPDPPTPHPATTMTWFPKMQGSEIPFSSGRSCCVFSISFPSPATSCFFFPFLHPPLSLQPVPCPRPGTEAGRW